MRKKEVLISVVLLLILIPSVNAAVLTRKMNSRFSPDSILNVELEFTDVVGQTFTLEDVYNGSFRMIEWDIIGSENVTTRINGNVIGWTIIPNSSTVIFKYSLTIPNKLGGYSSDLVWFDESGQGLDTKEFSVANVSCGNGFCEGTENCASCLQDCSCEIGEKCERGACESVSSCGNGLCEAEEDCFACNQDCSCSPGEICQEKICKTFCGNDICDPDEDDTSCADDCSSIDCGSNEDGICSEDCPVTDIDCEKEEERNKRLSLYTIIFFSVIVFLAIAGFVFYFGSNTDYLSVAKKSREVKKELENQKRAGRQQFDPRRLEYNVERIKNYIMMNSQKGHPTNFIRDTLLAAGWRKEIVDKAFIRAAMDRTKQGKI